MGLYVKDGRKFDTWYDWQTRSWITLELCPRHGSIISEGFYDHSRTQSIRAARVAEPTIECWLDEPASDR